MTIASEAIECIDLSGKVPRQQNVQHSLAHLAPVHALTSDEQTPDRADFPKGNWTRLVDQPTRPLLRL